MLFANNNRAYAVGNFKVIGENVVFNEHGISALEALAEKYTRRTTPDRLAKAVETGENGSLLIAGYDKGMDIRKVSLIKGAFEPVYHTKDNVQITLHDPLHALAFSHQRENYEKIAVVAKEGTRVFEHKPGTFLGDISSKYFTKLDDALKNNDLKRAEKVISAYLNEDFCAIDRGVYQIKQGLRRLFAPLIHVPNTRSEEETRTQDLRASKRDYGSAIANLRDLEQQQKEDLAGRLSKEYGVTVTALTTSSSLVLKGEKNEVETLVSRINNSRIKSSPEVTGIRESKMKLLKLPKPRNITSQAPQKFEHAELLHAYDAHELNQGENVLGAVMDTGVDYTHPFLESNFGDDKGYDFVRDAKNPLDLEGHGTHVAGIWKAVAPKVSLRAVRVLDEYGRGFEGDILLGYEYCYKNNVSVINCSFGAQWASEQERRVVEAAAQYDCVIVAAAGNESENENSRDIISYPAAFAGVQSVASVDRNKKHSPFSNMGYVTLAAMGEDVLSTLPGNRWARMDGTSMASPGVAGALTLMFSARPNESLTDKLMLAQQLCERESEDDEWMRRYGHGIPDCCMYVRTDELWTGALKSITKQKWAYASLCERMASPLMKEAASSPERFFAKLFGK